MLKIKVVFGECIRIFKFEDTELLEEALGALKDFVSVNFKVKHFVLRYKDDEEDLVRIDSVEDFKDALDLSQNGKTVKVFVSELKDDVEQQKVEKENVPEPPFEDLWEEKSDVSDENNFENFMNDDNFRHELVAFLQDVVIQVREGDNLELAVDTALSSHPSLSEIPHIKHFVSLLPVLSTQMGFVLPLIASLDPNTIPGLVESFFTSLTTGNNANLPPFIQMLLTQYGMLGANSNQQNFNPMFGFGGFDGFSGRGGHGFYGRGGGFRGCGRRGRGRGRGRGFHNWRHGHHGDGFYDFGQNSNWNVKDHDLSAEMISDDISLSDKAPVLPKQTVIKTWRLKNTGKDWPQGTQLVYIGRRSNPLVENNKRFIVPAIKSGEEENCSVVLEIPTQNGNHSCVWRLHTPNGHAFGPMLRARVVVLEEINDLEAKEAAKASKEETSVNVPTSSEPKLDYEQELQILSSMGFNDVELNRFLLDEHHGQVNTVLQILCEIKA